MRNNYLNRSLKGNERRFFTRLAFVLVLFFILLGLNYFDFKYKKYVLVPAFLGLIISLNLVKSSLICPDCHQNYWPPFGNACSKCGVVWGQKNESSAPHKVIELNRSHQTLEVSFPWLNKWNRYEKKIEKICLGLSIFVGFATGLFALFLPKLIGQPFSWGFMLFATFAGGTAYVLGWFFLLFIPGNFFHTIYWGLKARCPGCRQRFTSDVTFFPGVIVMRRSVPDFCPGCGVKLQVKQVG